MLIGEETISVEHIVAQEVEKTAVQFIRAGLSNNANNAARIAAVLGVVVTGQDAEFLNCVRVGIINNVVV